MCQLATLRVKELGVQQFLDTVPAVVAAGYGYVVLLLPLLQPEERHHGRFQPKVRGAHRERHARLDGSLTAAGTARVPWPLSPGPPAARNPPLRCSAGDRGGLVRSSADRPMAIPYASHSDRHPHHTHAHPDDYWGDGDIPPPTPPKHTPPKQGGPNTQPEKKSQPKPPSGKSDGPTEIPQQADAAHPDVYVPPYDAANPPAKQFQFRYDANSDKYAAIAEWDARTGQWRTYDKEEFKQFNKGSQSIGTYGEEKQAGNTTYLLNKDHKTGRKYIVGVKVNGKVVYLPSQEVAQRASGIGTRALPDMPKHTDAPDSEFVAPPGYRDGMVPKLQYLFRKDPSTGIYCRVGERHNEDGKSTDVEYTQEQYAAANAAVENNYKVDLPPEDPEHPDFQAKDVGAPERKLLLRYIDGRYQLVGYQSGGKKIIFDAKTREDIGNNYKVPKSRDELTPADLSKPADAPMDDQVVPPTGKPGTTSYIFRYDPNTNGWYMFGESKTDDSGQVQTRNYDEAEFKAKNRRDPNGKPPSTKDEYQALNSNYICTKDKKTGQVKIIGLYVGGAKYYFEAKSSAAINQPDNVKGDFQPNDPTVPQDVPPKAGDKDSAAAGHPDFNSKSTIKKGGKDVFIIWRWDKTVNRYCAAGEYYPFRAGAEAKFVMYTNEEYQKMNSGPDRKIPPSEGANFQYPAFAPDGPTAVNTETKTDERIVLLDSPNDPPGKKGDWQDGTSVSGYPIYKKLANGDQVIVGIKIEARDDGRMDKDAPPRIHYFSQNEFRYYNPGGKATTNQDVLHAKQWESYVSTHAVDQRNQPSYDFNGATDGRAI
jgi:hypothetical protein